MSESAPKRLLKKEKPKKSKGPVVAVVTLVAVVALLAGGYFGLCSWVKGNGLTLPGTTVSGLPGGQTVDISKLSSGDAAKLLSDKLADDLSGRALTVTFAGQTARLDGGSLLEADPQAPVSAALAYKAEQPLWKLGMLWLGMGGASEHTASALVLTDEGEAQIQRLADQIADTLYVAPVDYTYELTDTTVELTRGTDGQAVDADALARSMAEALISGEETLDVTPVTVPCTELTGESLSQEVYVAPQSSTVGADGKLTPTVVGHSVDADKAQTILDETAPGESCSIPLIFLQPDLSSAEQLLYRDLLASSKTYMAGTTNRRTNIRLAAKAVDGTILMPGDTFSYNKTVGERTAAKGYKEATVYVAGQDKQELGGGICQLASAIYYCTLYADLQIVSRTNHRFAVTYVPYGLDATVAWPSLDYKFKNNTDYPIKISATTDGNDLIVKLYGTRANDNYVEMKTVQLSKTPFNTVYKIDESLAAGQTKDLVHAYTGYKYESYRCVYDGKGNLLSKTFEASSTYSYRDKVIGVSPADAAQYGLPGGTATPEPIPAPSTEPSPSTEPVPPVESPTTEPEPDPTDDNTIPDWLAP